MAEENQASDMGFLPKPPAIPKTPQSVAGEALEDAAFEDYQKRLDGWLEDMHLYMKTLENWSAWKALGARLKARGLDVPENFEPPMELKQELCKEIQRLLDTVSGYLRRAPVSAQAPSGVKRQNEMQSI